MNRRHALTLAARWPCSEVLKRSASPSVNIARTDLALPLHSSCTIAKNTIIPYTVPHTRKTQNGSFVTLLLCSFEERPRPLVSLRAHSFCNGFHFSRSGAWLMDVCVRLHELGRWAMDGACSCRCFSCDRTPRVRAPSVRSPTSSSSPRRWRRWLAISRDFAASECEDPSA